MLHQLRLTSLEDTAFLGKELGRLLEPGDIILLTGDLGVGKTTLVKSMASAVGIDEADVTSPSFAIIHEHALPDQDNKFVHVDLYRLGEEADITETGLEEYLDGRNIVVVEWGNFLYDTWNLSALKIDISFDFYDEQMSDNETVRNVKFEADDDWTARIENLRLA